LFKWREGKMDLRRMRTLLVALIMLMLAFGAGAFGTVQSENAVLLTLSVIDVGQGDSVLISTSNGQAMLIDGGPAEASPKVLEAISKAGCEKLDVLMSTHPHADHIGGLARVLDEVPVGKVIDSGKVHTSKTYEGYLEKILAKDIPFALGRAGSSFALGPATVKILWPVEPLAQNINDCSIVVHVLYGKFSALLTGDIEEPSEQALIKAGSLSPTMVLKVSHHGSDTSTMAAFLSIVRPAIAIISAGTGKTATAIRPRTFLQGSRPQGRRFTGLIWTALSTSGPTGRAGRLRANAVMGRRRLLPQRLSLSARSTMGARTLTFSTTHGADTPPASRPRTCACSTAGKRRSTRGTGHVRCASHKAAKEGEEGQRNGSLIRRLHHQTSGRPWIEPAQARRSDRYDKCSN